EFSATGAHAERQPVKRVSERCSVRWNVGAGRSLRRWWTLTRQGGKFTPCGVIAQSLVFASTSLENSASGLPLLAFSVSSARRALASRGTRAPSVAAAIVVLPPTAFYLLLRQRPGHRLPPGRGMF